MSAVDVLLLALLVLVLALLLQPFQLALVRILEGYWGTSATAASVAATWTNPRRRWLDGLRKRHAEMSKLATGTAMIRLDEQVEAITTARNRSRLEAKLLALELRHPPTDERLLPTALGNALRSFEDRAGQRYGLETIPVFRRLYAVMPESMIKIYAGHRMQLDAAASMSVAFGAITVLTAAGLWRSGWWLFVPVATALLGIITYEGAISSALMMGLDVTTAFDLYRHDLVGKLGHPMPPDAALEYAFNRRLSRWLSGRTRLEENERPFAASWLSDFAVAQPSGSEREGRAEKARQGTPPEATFGESESAEGDGGSGADD